MIGPLPPLLLRGDCLVELARIPDSSVDSVVTDPPYGLEFMGKAWDGSDGFRRSLNAADTARDSVFGRTSRTSPEYRAGHLFESWTERWAAECLRILKPGGHLLAFGGSRTWHRLTAGIEDAGFEIRDSIAWLYGSGFPKSMDVSKAIDKAAGATRKKVRKTGAASAYSANAGNDRPWMREAREAGFIEVDGDEPATDEARQWEGWGTALKPAFEPVVVARKPIVGTVAANVLAHGTGALNIDASRIGSEVRVNPAAGNKPGGASLNMSAIGMPEGVESREAAGRWPANVVLDESQAAALDAQSGTTKGKRIKTKRSPDTDSRQAFGAFAGQAEVEIGYDDVGGASRFFYVAKAPKSERPIVDGTAHPTVKPLALMRWLIRLVTPPEGCVVDPFAGSGTTLEAAYLEGFESIGVEMTPDYWPLVEARIARVTA